MCYPIIYSSQYSYPYLLISQKNIPILIHISLSLFIHLFILQLSSENNNNIIIIILINVTKIYHNIGRYLFNYLFIKRIRRKKGRESAPHMLSFSDRAKNRRRLEPAWGPHHLHAVRGGTALWINTWTGQIRSGPTAESAPWNQDRIMLRSSSLAISFFNLTSENY